MAPASPIGALVAYLRADTDVAALVGTRVFGVELPTGQGASMPRKAVVISSSGGAGFGSRSYVGTRHPRIDVRCYGETFVEADDLHWTVYAALKHLTHEVAGEVLIYTLTTESEQVALRDADGAWPLMLSVWNATVSEQVIEEVA